MEIAYIPYIKYVISPGTRFERDKKVLFDPDGEVAQGRPLINYGWAPSGLKELIEALYKSKKGTLRGFDFFYKSKILKCEGNIVDVLRDEGLIGDKFPALLRIKIKDRVEVPALLVNIDRMYFKRCKKCGQNWRIHGIPEDFLKFLREMKLERLAYIFPCSRFLCKFLCENYDNCIRSYTSKEGDPKIESEKLECLKELLKQISGRSKGSKRWECIPKKGMSYEVLKREILRMRRVNRNSCIERHLRFDFTPLRYFFFDYKTWAKMQKRRYSKGPMHNIDALPAKLLSDFISSYDQYLDGTQLIAPINHEGVLEAFLNVSKVKFEIKIQLSAHRCRICHRTHRITDIPIKAMFRDSEVFKHEAGFAELLWRKIWEKFPREFCRSFGGRNTIKISESKVLRREMKVQEVERRSKFALSSYDYAVDLRALGKQRLLLFDLTTGLWKKSGFHEVGRSSEEYVEMWKETLFEIPNRKPWIVATWYIVVNSTEEIFFDGTAPHGVKNMKELVNLVVSGKWSDVALVSSEEDLDLVDPEKKSLVVVPVFNSTQRKGEARTEIRRLERKNFERLLIWNVIDRLFA